ncbi:uncharacterized protein [Hyperolius riggenbachi]|uniref:uncharacterized protein n=1 Tax=Hyperolius riggenbachi TaxID=752182 RepID=UPI0035A2A9C8
MNKWRSVRDTYKKHLEKMKKLERSGSASIPTPTYKHFELLSFLKQIYEPRRTEDSFMEAHTHEEDSQSSVVSPAMSGELCEGTSEMLSPQDSRSSTQDSRSSTVSQSTYRQTRAKQRRKPTDVEADSQLQMQSTYTDILNYLKSNRERQRAMENNTSYTMLMSVLPYVEKINPKHHTAFHIALIQLADQFIQKGDGTAQPPSDSQSSVSQAIAPPQFWTPSTECPSSFPPHPQQLTARLQHDRAPNYPYAGDGHHMYSGNQGRNVEARTYHNLEGHRDVSGQGRADTSMTRYLFDYDATE